MRLSFQSTVVSILLLPFLLAPSSVLAQKKSLPLPVVNPKVLIETNYGDITIELYAEKAPITVANFLRYADEGFYENTLFHRVIRDFMIQAGGFTMDYQKKPTHKAIRNEANNGLLNVTGTLAMARTPDPHSATSQFFINVVDNMRLDFSAETPEGWGYCVFGRVISGMNFATEISHAVTGPAGPFDLDSPQGMIFIKKITRLPVANSPAAKPATISPPKLEKPKPETPNPQEAA